MSTQTISIPLTDAESASLDTVRAAFQKQEQRFLRLVNFEVLQFDNGLQNVGEYAANVDEGDLPPVEVLEIPEDATEVATLRRELQNRTALYYGAVAVGPGTRNLLLARAGAPAAGGFISTAVANALAEWEFFERQEQDFDGSRIRRGKQEFEPDASARVHEYWKTGTRQNFSGTDRNQPWSAAFISYIMKVSGAGTRFKYDTAHRTYIFAAINARDRNPNYGYWGFRLSERSPEVGDLICAWRSTNDFPGPVTFEDASRGVGSYPAHCDLVVEKSGNTIATIGGNVSESVTKKHFRLSPAGLLTTASFGKGFAVLANRMDEAGGIAAAGQVKAAAVPGAPPANPAPDTGDV